MEMAVRLKAFSPLGLGPGPSCAPLGSETCGPWFSDPRRCLAMESLPLTPLPPCISFAGLKEGDLWGADREAEGEEVGARGRAKATPQGSPHPAQPIQSRPHWNLVLYTLPSTHPHRRLILPSPHPPPPPPGSKIKATRDAATVLSLLGKTEPLSAGTGRTRELLGWPRLGPVEAWALAPVRCSISSTHSQGAST